MRSALGPLRCVSLQFAELCFEIVPALAGVPVSQQRGLRVYWCVESEVFFVVVLQVLPGSTEPAVLREALRASLPQAPPAEQQPVRFPAMLHTTVGRLLAPPRRPDSPGHPGMVCCGCGGRARHNRQSHCAA
jgi:hypothetical protein